MVDGLRFASIPYLRHMDASPCLAIKLPAVIQALNLSVIHLPVGHKEYEQEPSECIVNQSIISARKRHHEFHTRPEPKRYEKIALKWQLSQKYVFKGTNMKATVSTFQRIIRVDVGSPCPRTALRLGAGRNR